MADWSPTWTFDEAAFDRTASAFDNPDFVEVVIHSYRHRYGLAAETRLTRTSRPPSPRSRRLPVPSITIDGDADGVNPGTTHHAQKFAGPHEHRVFKGAGHNLPQERPARLGARR